MVAVFEARAASTGYGGTEVIKGVDFSVVNEVFAVLGANGAGKTTLLASMAGILPLTSGAFFLKGEPISGLPPWRIAALGVGYVPQERGIFSELTVGENLRIGSLVARRSYQESLEDVIDLFPDIAGLLAQKAGTLSGGQARMVAAGRALMQDPIVLLLDEPTAGLSPLYVDQFFQKIREIHETRGVAIIVAEQNATKALEVADRVMVLGLGLVSAIVDAANISINQIREGYRI